MLVELRVENFAIIERLNLSLAEGLITLTGETGAGKSILIDALEMLLGARADHSLIRTGCKSALIEGTFQLAVEQHALIESILVREQLFADDPDFIVLGRELRREGRSVARVNGRTVNLSVLRELGEWLVDVHGQSEHLSLLRIRQQLYLLDRFAEVQAERTAYDQLYREWLAVGRELEQVRQLDREAARQTDLLTYQIREIEAADPQPDEEQPLTEECRRLENSEHLEQLVLRLLSFLDPERDRSDGLFDLMARVQRDLNELMSFDSRFEEWPDRLDAIYEELRELSQTLGRFRESLESDPGRLAELQERLDTLRLLKRKYGDSLERVLAFAEQAREQLHQVATAEHHLNHLRQRRAALRQQLLAAGEQLSSRRQVAATRLATSIEQELADLKMPTARFQVHFQPLTAADSPSAASVAPNENPGAPAESKFASKRVTAPRPFGPDGLEQVEFLMSANAGEDFKPLAKVASGGEMARVMLALKTVLAQVDQTPTLIFDEVDTGIGGRVGAVVGQKLAQLARHHQVLCITHLPQVASYGQQHLRVAKAIHQKRTYTVVETLVGQQRLEELAGMLGGTSPTHLASAAELLATANTQRSNSQRSSTALPPTPQSGATMPPVEPQLADLVPAETLF